MTAEFPARYEPIERLGQGGSGEVWSARDRVTGADVALKLLRPGADEPEVMALVREATALSGIEGLGVPRVLHFGRLPRSGRVYLARELVVGSSLADLINTKSDARVCLGALIQAADLLTSLHRALLLHGDVKPANIIVGPDGRATLVDLGLAAAWREGGARPEGLTPRYAAPELFRCEPLTPQAEVYALGASLEETLSATGRSLGKRHVVAARAVARRATSEVPAERYPSVDEFAEALRSALQLDDAAAMSHRGTDTRRVWTIVGGDAVSAELLSVVAGMPSGSGLIVGGPSGSGRTTLLRRLSWSLGVGGHAVVDIAAGEPATLDLALAPSMLPDDPSTLVLLVDDADRLPESDFRRIDALRARGARLVATVGGRPGEVGLESDRTFGWFQVSPLQDVDARALVARFMPSLRDEVARQLVSRAGGFPGPLRATIERLESRAVVSLDDLDAALEEAPVPSGVRIDLVEVHRLLDRGRLDTAAEYLEAYADEVSLSLSLARAKLLTGRGEPVSALDALVATESLLASAMPLEVAAWHGQKARAHLRAGDHSNAEVHANRALSALGTDVEAPADELAPLGAHHLIVDALAVAGLARSLSGRHALALDTLERAAALARIPGEPRVAAVAFGSLAFALQRSDKLADAEVAYLDALEHAERAGDAGYVATTRLNLGTIAHQRGDIGSALAHLEAAVDMGRRSGRAAALRQALFNLASLDLYVGRLARAQASLDALAAERDRLSGAARAQLLGLEAESCVLAGELELGQEKLVASAEIYQELGRLSDAAEALLERILVLAKVPGWDPLQLQDELLAAEAILGDSTTHEALRHFAKATVAYLAGRWADSRAAFDECLAAAERRGQRDWVWRALLARAQLSAAEFRPADEADDTRRAVASLEAIAAPLPRDLKEVFWNDPRRRDLRGRPGSVAPPRPSLVAGPSSSFILDAEFDASAATQLGAPVPRNDRLSLLLEINRQLAGEYDLERLLDRIAECAVRLLDAEQGFVLLRSRSGEPYLSIHAARERDGNEPHTVFSRSIAERVLATGEVFLAVDAPSDERVAGYVSVHQLMLRSVVCAPIRARSGDKLGALYLETRLRSGATFAAEIPSLLALAEQSAIAIQTARLLSENRERALELEAANRELEAARTKLEEVLGRRTEQLAETKRSLRSVKAVLRGHFGYGDIVGTSDAMRSVYAVIERVKDADVPLLITGESGTGKEVIARTVHAMGSRAKQRFVGLNCGAIPEHLLESELFGHVRGAFTGADRDKKGLFRELDGGTILLDEIGEMPQKMQAGLLRVLQEKVLRPVGGTKEESVDVRVIAATHRDLADMVARGTFREDLYYRLNVIAVRSPSLRERAEDVPLLVDHFLRIFAARYSRERRSVSREATRVLQGYAWPGNVRQLENVLLNAWILSDGDELGVDDFDLPRVGAPPVRAPRSSEPSHRDEGATELDDVASREDYDEAERVRILDALKRTGWNRAEAARLVGIPRRTFYRRLARYGIQ
ncbi:MAG: sigma 54-interacting transcriptional regulator [Deltaproteobacteria bacterium]|nr:sigma 54-interacting transcriptional regulator [Deltaproteobacteria bacterium]